MIQYRRLHQAKTQRDKQRLELVLKLYQESFPYAPEYATNIAQLFRHDPRRDYEVVLLLAEGAKSRLLGFSLSFYFPELRYAYLDYLVSDPIRASRGIGTALHEATRELFAFREAAGLFIDVPPDDATLIKEPFRLKTNKRRLAFYERFNARPIINTLYDRISTPANEGHPTFLLYDGLENPKPLRRSDLKKTVARILAVKGKMKREDPKVQKIFASFKDDPVLLRPPTYGKPAAGPVRLGRLGTVDVVNVGDKHQIHHLKEKGYVERPSRIPALLKGLEGMPIKFHKVRSFPMGPIRAVHDAALINFLAKAPRKLSPQEMIYPNVFPIRKPERIPKNWEMQAGYFCIDTFTPLTANSYLAARNAADGALTGAELILDGSPLVYVLCRPPGHHAERRVFGGFCYLNNAAIAAHHLSQHGTVAFLDIDYHHGNGSQNIFYERKDVYFISIHGHPLHSYPYFSGFQDEKGEGEGLGFNRNFPLKPGADDARYLKTLTEAVSLIQCFKPEFLVVSVGFDIMSGDPTGSFTVTPAGVGKIGAMLGQLRLPTLLIQEGGYSLRNLRLGCRNFLLHMAIG